MPIPENQIQGQVVISGPLRGAEISVDQLNLQTGEIRHHVGRTVTDANGRFSLDVGLSNGVLSLAARGGSFDDLASGATVRLDPTDEIRTVTTLDPVEPRDDLLISPIGHLISARLPAILPTIDAARPLPVLDAYAIATASLSGHFGRVTDWTRLELADLDEKATSPTEPARAALVHAALSYLVHDIAEAANASSQDVNVLALTRQWATDISVATYDGDPLVFDGQDRNAKDGGLQLGVCPPIACTPEQQGCSDACRTLCDLYSGTVRSMLGGELTKIAGNPEINRTDLTTADILPIARAMSESTDRALFGSDTCNETLDRVPPLVLFDATVTPAEGALVRGVVTVKTTASDDIGVADLVIEGHADTDGDPNDDTAVAVIDTTTADRVLEIVATATDRSGNKGHATRTLVIDNTPPELAVDDAGFIVQAGVRWSTVAAPTVSGTASDAHGAAVRVSIGGTVIATADVTGSAWSVPLPVAMLGTAPTEVTFVAVDPLGNASAAVVRRFATDTTPPELSVIPTTVRNETNDLITFAPGTGTPSHVHTEAGRTTLDDSAGCPEVFKHAYLMEPEDPNPIRWQLRAVDDGIGLDPESARYRIGRDDGIVVGPWRPAPSTPSGNNLDLSIDAVRSGASGDAFLGTTEAVMAIDLEIADRLGRTTSIHRCWTHHPLAVPLSGTNAVAAAGHRFALSSNKLEVGAPFRALAAELINAGSKGLSLMDYELGSGTLETSFVTFTLTRPPTTTRRDYAKQSVLLGVTDLGNDRIACDDEPPPDGCGAPAHPPRATNVGSNIPLSITKYAVRVFELSSNGALAAELPCLRCEAGPGVWQFALAGKATSSAAERRYRVMTVVREVLELAPSGAIGDPDPGPFVETAVGNVGITGKVLDPGYTGCTRFETVIVGPPTDPEFRRFCTQHSTFQFYRALTRVEVAFQNDLLSQPASAPTAAMAPRSDGSLKVVRNIRSDQFTYTSIETLPTAP